MEERTKAPAPEAPLWYARLRKCRSEPARAASPSRSGRAISIPVTLPDKEMLAHYATRLLTVEINNTFYRMPNAELVAGWAARVPEGFRFVLKAPQRITHRERLKDSKISIAEFLKAAAALGDNLGALLFQLPPFFKKDIETLSAFLKLVPEAMPPIEMAFEFRHESGTRKRRTPCCAHTTSRSSAETRTRPKKARLSFPRRRSAISGFARRSTPRPSSAPGRRASSQSRGRRRSCF